MKRRTIILAALLLTALLAGCGVANKEKGAQNAPEANAEEGSRKDQTDVSGEDAAKAVPETKEETGGDGGLLTGRHYVEIHIKDKGVITVELDADSAPVSVTNFVNLTKAGFYDGLTFHRIIEGFMMQGGDPEGTGAGGSEESIKGEFSNNGVDNPLSHTRGAISMARSQLPDSARSQFFIVHKDSTFLDGDYAAFGYVTSGIEIVDDICENTTGQDANGVVPMENRPVIEKIEYLGE